MTASITFSIVIGGTSVSPDGSTLSVGQSGSLITSDGTWTFDGASAGGGTVILLNGSPIANGSGVLMEVANSGKLYVKNNAGNWYVWNGAAWDAASDPGVQQPPPPPPPPPPPTLSQSWNPPMPGGATFDDTTPLGTVVAEVQEVWSDGSPYTDSYQFISPSYDGTGAAPSGVSVITSATNYTLGAVISAADAAAITSTGIYALIVGPNHIGALVINPHGPGVAAAGGTTENVDVGPLLSQ